MNRFNIEGHQMRFSKKRSSATVCETARSEETTFEGDGTSRSHRSTEQARSARSLAAMGTGYKGHRTGSRKEYAHKLFDQLGPERARHRIIASGIRPHTITTWFSQFRKALTTGGNDVQS
jgi:hypothetical protein